MSADAGRLPAIVFAALVLATGGGLLVAQRVKHTPPVAREFRLTPAFRPSTGGIEQIAFSIAHGHGLTVVVIGPAGEAVATLVSDLQAPSPRVCLTWNGRRGRGRFAVGAGGVPAVHPVGACQTAPVLEPPRGPLAPPGEYKVRVELRHRRPTLSPEAFTLLGAHGA